MAVLYRSHLDANFDFDDFDGDETWDVIDSFDDDELYELNASRSDADADEAGAALSVRAGSFDDSLSPTSALLREPIADDRDAALTVEDAPHLTGPISSWASLSMLDPGFTA